MAAAERWAGGESRASLASELRRKLAGAGGCGGGGGEANSSRRLDELIAGRAASWLEQKTVIVDIRNGQQTGGGERASKSSEIGKTEGRKKEEAKTLASDKPANSKRAEADKRVPTFGRLPSAKLTRLPYFSYHGKARNVALLSAAERAPSGTPRYVGEAQQSDDSPGSSQRSLSDGSPSSTGGRRRPTGYSNISNLFPRAPPGRSRSESLSNLGRQVQASQVQASQVQQLGRRESRSALSLSPAESASMRRQNGQQQQQQVVGKRSTASYFERRPASTLGHHQRAPSASSLYYGGSAGASSPFGLAGEPLLDPDCPVHGASPWRPASRSQADGEEQADLYAAPAATPAYYDGPGRFSVFGGPAGGGASLAPPGEQLRRILGRPASREPRPLHLHPQWAYTRPFAQLAAGGRPRFVPLEQLEDSQAIRAVDFHPSGQVYAVGSNSRALRICAYPAAEGAAAGGRPPGPPRVLFKFLQLHRGSIYCVRFNRAGRLLATGSNDQTLHLARYNPITHSPDGDEFRLSMHDGTVRALCFIDDTSNGASLLLSAGAGDNKIYVTDCDTVTPFQSLAGHAQTVMALEHWAGAQFVSASQDRTIRLWDLRTRACTSIISAPANKWAAGPGAPVCSVQVDPSGRLLASGHADATCMLYDLRGAKPIQTFRQHRDEVRTVSFSPKSYYLLTSGYDGRLLLADLQGDLTQPLPSLQVAESRDKVVQACWHPTELAFVATCADKTATLWAAAE